MGGAILFMAEVIGGWKRITEGQEVSIVRPLFEMGSLSLD